jgi:putative phosphoribosyl transferase
LPRGGVPVAAEIARRLRLPLDVLLVRKLGVPGHPELAMGAIAAGGIEVLNDGLIEELGVPRSLVQQVAVREQLELDRRDRLFREGREHPLVTGRSVIVVDDGLATGATMEAAIHALRRMKAHHVIVAVPVGARETCDRLGRLADAVVCLSMPEPMNAVGLWYQDFTQTSDEEVRRLLEKYRTTADAESDGSADPSGPVRRHAIAVSGDADSGDAMLGRIDDARVVLPGAAPHGAHGGGGQLSEKANSVQRAVRVPVGSYTLDGDLEVPLDPRGLILFAHGSGSSRQSPRNKYVARILVEHRFATLLIDLLTPEEEAIDERTAHLRFDIDMLAKRLVRIVDWTRSEPPLSHLPIGLFGASTGGGAALAAAAARPRDVGAVVSRGGRPDLADGALPDVAAPTLLIVGGRDPTVIELNRQAMRKMRADVALEIIPGATHLFEEPGALAQVATAASTWFDNRLIPAGVPGAH